MKKIVLALSLAAIVASCRSTTDLNSSNVDGVVPTECCSEGTECCSEAASDCCSDAASECCSSEAEVCPVTGASME